MPPEALAALIAATVTVLSTPVAIALAHRTSFLDSPAGYKRHARATPYLGGLAVFAGLLAALPFAHRYGLLVAAAGALLIVGTADDRLNLSPLLRVALEAGVAAALWADGLGWNVLGPDAADLALTIVWVVGVVNAFNLFDNMDGACSSIAAASAAGVGALAAATGQHALAAVCFALVGACVAFLRFNLARPARIFLGDGGSMPVGLVVAATAMVACSHDGFGIGAANVAIAVVMVGTAALDTALVIVSRVRAGRPLLSGGNDHLTHRVAPALGSTRRVAFALAAGQLLLCGAALGAGEAGLGYVVAFGIVAVVGGGAVIAALDGLRPPVPATAASVAQRA